MDLIIPLIRRAKIFRMTPISEGTISDKWLKDHYEKNCFGSYKRFVFFQNDHYEKNDFLIHNSKTINISGKRKFLCDYYNKSFLGIIRLIYLLIFIKQSTFS